jgi:hypothetical protein
MRRRGSAALRSSDGNALAVMPWFLSNLRPRPRREGIVDLIVELAPAA